MAGYGWHRKLVVGFRMAGYAWHRSQWVNTAQQTCWAFQQGNKHYAS